jgi:hypothetical protein
MNSQLDFATNSDRHSNKVFERVGNATVRRVFQRDKAILSVTPIDLFKDCTNAADGEHFDAGAKTMDRGEVTVGVGWTQERHA